MENLKIYNPNIKEPEPPKDLARRYSGDDAKFAAFTYIPFVGPAILVFRKENSEFVSYHGKMALVLFVLGVLGFFLLPSIFKLLAVLVTFSVSIYGLYKATKGDKWYLPLVSKLAQMMEV